MSGRTLQKVVASVAVALALVSCSDSRPVAGPNLGADERPKVLAAAKELVSLDPLEVLTPVQATTLDECGLVGDRPFGGASSDPRQFTCSVLQARVFTSPPGSEMSSIASQLDESLRAAGCTGDDGVTWNAIDDGHASLPFTTASFTCSGSTVVAGISDIDLASVESVLLQVQLIEGGNGVVNGIGSRIEPRTVTNLDSPSGTLIVAISAQATYVDALVCGDLRLCN